MLYCFTSFLDIAEPWIFEGIFDTENLLKFLSAIHHVLSKLLQLTAIFKGIAPKSLAWNLIVSIDTIKNQFKILTRSLNSERKRLYVPFVLWRREMHMVALSLHLDPAVRKAEALMQ